MGEESFVKKYFSKHIANVLCSLSLWKIRQKKRWVFFMGGNKSKVTSVNGLFPEMLEPLHELYETKNKASTVLANCTEELSVCVCVL